MRRQFQLKMIPRKQKLIIWYLFQLKGILRSQAVSLISETLTFQGMISFILELSSQNCHTIALAQLYDVLMDYTVWSTKMVVIMDTTI